MVSVLKTTHCTAANFALKDKTFKNENLNEWIVTKTSVNIP